MKQIDYIRIPRKDLIFGRFLKHFGWWPDLNIRFFKKRQGQIEGSNPSTARVFWKKCIKLIFRSKSIMIYLLILFLFILLRMHLAWVFPNSAVSTDHILFLTLLKQSSFPRWTTFLFGFGNLIVLSLICRRFGGRDFIILSTLLYAISPWFIYLEVFNSTYIYLLFWILLGLYGLVRLKTDKDKIGVMCVFIASAVLLYSSLLAWAFVLVLLVMFARIFNLFASKLRYIFAVCFFLLVLPMGIMFYSSGGVKNIFAQQFTLFSNPGLIDTVNHFQGESRGSNMAVVSRLFENKYQYLFKHALYNFLVNLSPATYFTAQEKLLGFSFNSPIYLAFIIPFFHGLYLLFKKKIIKPYYSSLLVLLLPSTVSQYSPDLQKLVIVAPALILVISFGLIHLFKKKGRLIYRLLLFLTVGLIVFQLSVSLMDTIIREPLRFSMYQKEVSREGR